MNAANFNPRYVAYAKVHGNTPQQQLIVDEEAWPGGIMCGFILWIAKQKAAFYKKDGYNSFIDKDTISDYAAWDKFLGI